MASPTILSRSSVPLAEGSSGPSMIGTNARFRRTEGTDFINTSRDSYKLVFNFPTGSRERGDDPIHVLTSTIPPLLAEMRNIRSQPEVEETTETGGGSALPQDIPTDQTSRIREHGAVAITNIASSDPSLLPVPKTIADKYTRTMLKRLAGFPLYKPKPYNKSSTTYLREGIRPGDVGFIRENGAFDFLFNICPSQNDSINPPELPINFTLQGSEDSEIYDEEQFAHNTRLFDHPIYRKRGLFGCAKYTCTESEGAILELPEGATRYEVIKKLPFKELAIRYAVEWYRYTMSQGRDITNGSLYLVTSSTKCIHWGIAVIERRCPPWEGLQFFRNSLANWFLPGWTPKYHWSDSSTFTTTAAPNPDPQYGSALNQCVFLRGYKIRLREDIWNGLNDEWRRGELSRPPFSSSIDQTGNTTRRGKPSNGGRHRQHQIWSGTRPGLRTATNAGRQLEEPTNRDLSIMAPPGMESGEVILHADFDPSPAHPSDIINSALLTQEPDAKIAITHDDAWCDLLQDIFLNQPLDLAKVAPSYISFIDEHGCISFEKASDPRSLQQTMTKDHNILNESWKTFSTRWNQSKNFRWSVIAILLVLVMSFIPILDRSQPKFKGDVDYVCRSPKIIQQWHITAFRPKWFGLLGSPGPITYKTEGHKGHRVSIVDIDRRDIEIEMYIDDKDFGHKPVDVDNTVECGDNLARCLNMGFSAATISVPPGKHTVRAEILDVDGAFRWGNKRYRRVWWMVEGCS